MKVQILCFLWFLACTSEAIKCKHCLERNLDHCTTEEIIECSDNTGCAAVSGFFQEGLKKTKFFYKGCWIPIPCESWLCISINGTYMQSYTTCCDREKCDLQYYIPSDEDEPYNGIKCKSCYKEGTTDECKSEETQKCRGDELACVDYRGFLNKLDEVETDVSFKGCANTLAYKHFELFYSFKELRRKKFTSTFFG